FITFEQAHFSFLAIRANNSTQFSEFCKFLQRKGDPDAACFLRSSLLNGVAGRGSQPLRQRDASLHRPCGLFRSIAPVLGAAYGRKPSPNLEINYHRITR
ncbi:MAG: hypothetical protein LUQ11_01680, partial [Methylococcaceae bacterium]|nr:hypothetical protein [Methylococcaceae bacterium]